MTIATVQISESLQMLIDSRLDTLDRMLLGRVSRQDRLTIVREVESQIHELLQERDGDELTREDVLAVLGRLDPPEAYIPDGIEGERLSLHGTIPAPAHRPVVKAGPKVGRTSGILGLAALALMLLLPLDYAIAVALQSSAVSIILFVVNLLLMFSAGVLGLALGVHARKNGSWAIVGIVTSLLALFLSLAIVLVAILLG